MQRLKHIFRNWYRRLRRIRDLPFICLNVVRETHVHCFVSAPPKLSITAIVKYLKGITGRKLFERFPEIRNQLWKGELWNHSYYVETVGSVSEENIRRYIEHQSKAY
ncbi:MAG: IS200/IS605 family transposase [Lachnospiraceae bacterium]